MSQRGRGSSNTAVSMSVFTPLVLPVCGLTLRNRLIRAAAFAGGSVTEQAETHGEAARGGVALSTVAYTAVSADGRTFASQLLLREEAPPAGLAAIAEAAHVAGGLLCVQLTHAGGFADRALCAGSPALAPSAHFDVASFSYPRACSAGDMDRLVADFAGAARCACLSGAADGVEVHLGHGYLLSQWLSPLTNSRADEHGGSAENRLRFPLRVVRAVRDAIGAKKAVFVKLNVDDGFAGGVTLADVAYFASQLCSERGLLDGLILSAGFVNKNGFFMLRGRVPRAAMVRALARESYGKAAALALLGRWLVPELPFSEGFLLAAQRSVLAAVRGAGIPIIAVGGFVSLTGVEGALSDGFAAVQMARALIREPDLPLRWERHAINAAGGGAGGDASAAANSLCSHCNACVVAALAPDMPARCIERPLHDAPPRVGDDLRATSGAGDAAVRDIEDVHERHARGR